MPPSAADIRADVPTGPAIDRRREWRRCLDGHLGILTAISAAKAGAPISAAIATRQIVAFTTGPRLSGILTRDRPRPLLPLCHSE